MKVGAWYDPQANELRIRLREATPAEARQTLRHLSRFLQLLPLPELRALGQAIQVTLEEEGATTQDDNGSPPADVEVLG
jgi:hypothetical protein